jgi:hypothetical protein
MNRLASLALVVLVACGSSPPPKRPDPRPAGPGSASTPTAAEPAAPATCDDACTAYAGCYEDVYKKDFERGGECVSSCEEMAEADRAKYIADWTASDADCATLIGQ